LDTLRRHTSGLILFPLPQPELFVRRFARLALLLLAACGTTARSGAAPELPPLLVLVSIDGFRWDFVERPEAAGLRAIAQNGVRARHMQPVFPTKTFPNHYSLVTGLWAEHHGIVGNTMEDPELGRFTIGDTAEVREAGWWGGEPIWVTAVKQNRRAAAMFWPGSEAAVAGVRPTWYMRYDNELPHDVRVRQVVEWLRLPPDSAPAFITLYFSAVDGAAHRFGVESPQVDTAISRVDSAVTALWQAIQQSRMGSRVNLVIVSDHGMANTTRDRVVILDDWLESGTYHVVDWNPVALIRPAEGKEAEVYDRLSRASHLSVYRKAEVPERWHFRDHPRITPIVAVAEEGWSITSRENFQRAAWFGTGASHGYDNALESMQATFIAAGPAFATGKVVPRVRNVDVYALMAHVLGLRPAANDGSLDSIRVVLNPSASQ
jgi:predicted AlkP superfamily pyrophosphatase or phosphodiesterase